MAASYVIFIFVFIVALCCLLSYRKKWLSYLPGVISPYLYGRLVNWTSAFYLRFCCTVLPRILKIYYYSLWIGLFQLFVIVNCILCFFLCNFTSNGICIEQIYYLINLYFFVVCMGHPKSVVTQYLGTLQGFQNY